MKKKQETTVRAAALKYDGLNAPKIVAKGSGSVAEKIIASAKEHNVHLHNDPILMAVLSRLELGDEIPRPLYLAVAKIIAFAYFLQGKHPESVKSEQYRPKSSEANSQLTYSNKDLPAPKSQ